MNHTYKTIWNAATGAWAAVQETARSRGKASGGGAGGAAASILGFNARFALTAMATAIFFFCQAQQAQAQITGNQTWVGTRPTTGATYTAGMYAMCFYDVDTQSVLCGDGTTSTVNNASTNTAKSVALGIGAKTAGESNVALGSNSSASHTSGLAIGASTRAHHNQTVAIGEGASALGTADIMIGKHSGGGTSTGNNVGIGENAVGSAAAANNIIGIGSNAAQGISGQHVVAIGTNANQGVTANNAVAVGFNSKTAKNSAVAIGYTAVADGQNSVAIGVNSAISGDNGVAVGNAAKAGATSVALGVNTVATQPATVALGSGATAGQQRAIAIGENATASGQHSVAIGAPNGADKTTASGLASVAVGRAASASGARSVAIGEGAKAQGEQSISIGTGNAVQAARSGAIGDPTTIIASATDSYSIGNNNTVNTADTFVMGNNVTTAVGDSVYLGKNAAATAAATAQSAGTTAYASQAIGGHTYNFAGGTPVGVVSVGSAGGERRIQNVAAGLVSATSTDAINGSQLYALAQRVGSGSGSATRFYHVNSTDSAAGNYNNDGATAVNALAAGVRSSAPGNNAVAVGSDVTASGNESVAVGNNVQATQLGATAIGNNARATEQGAQAFGQSSSASGFNSAAVGRFATASGDRAAAFGIGNTASGVSSLALGDQSKAVKLTGIAIGKNAQAGTEDPAIVLTTNDADAIAIGTNSVAYEKDTVALGNAARATADSATALGKGSRATQTFATAVGLDAQASGSSATALGSGAQSAGDSATALGNDANASGNRSLALGVGASSAGGRAIAIGESSEAKSVNSIALGWDADIDTAALRGIAIGQSATVTSTAQNGMALGVNSNAAVEGGVALGFGAIADRAALTAGAATSPTASAGTNTVYASDAATAADKAAVSATVKGSLGAVSVGNANATRQITNVAAGSENTDAVNVAQLKAVASVANSPLTITGNTLNDTGADGTQQTLGSTLDISGGLAAGKTSSNSNIRTVITDGKVDIQFADAPTFAGTVTAPTIVASGAKPITIDGAAGTVTGLSNTTWNGTATSGRAATEDQLAVVATQAGQKGKFTLTAQGANGSEVENGETVDLRSADGNLIVSKAAANNNVTFRLAQNINLGAGGSVTTGATTVSNAGVHIAHPSDPAKTVSLTGAGLNNGGNRITGVGTGVDATDAVNKAQLDAAITNVGGNVTNLGLVIGGNTFVDANGQLTNAGKQALKTYDVSGQTATENSNVVAAIKNMNEGGIKYFHTNDASGQVTGGTLATNTHDSSASGRYATAVGYEASATAENALAIGKGAVASGVSSISIGVGNQVLADRSGAIGDPTTIIASATDSYSIGNTNTVNTADTFVMGNNVTTTVDNSVYLGGGAAAVAARTGQTAGKTAYNSETIHGVTHNYAGGTPAGVVTVGSVGQERRIQNVAAGLVSATSTDAINGSQLYAAHTAINTLGTSTALALGGGSSLDPSTGEVKARLNVGGTTYTNVQNALNAINTTASGGWRLQANGDTATEAHITPASNAVNVVNGSNTTVSIAGNQLQVNVVNNPTFSGPVTANGGMSVANNLTVQPGTTVDMGGNRITNVADGVNPTDAVTVQQLRNIQGGNTQSLAGVQHRIHNVERDLRGGVASAMAMAGLPQAYLPGKSMFAAGASTYRGATAIAVGLSTISDNGKWVIKGTASGNNRGHFGAAIGAGYQW